MMKSRVAGCVMRVAEIKRRVLVCWICCALTVLSLTGCGRSQEACTAVAAVAEAVPVEETDPYKKYDHVVEVDGVEVGLKDIEGYKPYVIHFIYSTWDNTDGNATDGNAFFKDSNKQTVSLDDAKKKGIIADYELLKGDEMLVMYVKENKNGLSLMPAPGPGDLRLSFESDIEAYSVMWSDAAMAKIGLGNEYKMIDISPSVDIEEDAVVCVKEVLYETYFHGAFGANVGQYYLFVKDVKYGEYTTIK
ncbi:MAG: hypothetical protein J5525_08675 [Lachnospiraceae bacterium]|nr:hypothetical protein [Lachnospiraceae bacterium]